MKIGRRAWLHPRDEKEADHKYLQTDGIRASSNRDSYSDSEEPVENSPSDTALVRVLQVSRLFFSFSLVF